MLSQNHRQQRHLSSKVANAGLHTQSHRKHTAPARIRALGHALTSPCTTQAWEWVLLIPFGEAKPAIQSCTNHVYTSSLPWWTLLFHSMTGMEWKPWSYIFLSLYRGWGLPWWHRQLSVCLQCGRPGFDPWVRKILWRRKWQPAPALFPGKSCGQRCLVGYSPWDCKNRTRLRD